MQPVAVRILHPAGADEHEREPLEARLVAERRANAERLIGLFDAAGGSDVEIVTGPPDEPFAERLRGLTQDIAGRGLVLLGSGAVPLATIDDIRAFLEVAGSGTATALANNRYSADVVAIGEAGALRDVPDLPGDNSLPRWLEEVAGFEVRDLRDRWWLAMDLDSPLDGVLLEAGATDGTDAQRSSGSDQATHVDLSIVRRAIDGVRAVATDRRAELVIAGRTSAATLGWLERSTPSRIRALIEERGLRASTERALAAAEDGRRSARTSRPPRSIVGFALDDRGPSALGAMLAELGDAAVVDSRVLLAHRLGPDERAWPRAEDRFASDLLLPDGIEDPWLRDLTASARDAVIPILLGGHSLVGPGIRLALGDRP